MAMNDYNELIELIERLYGKFDFSSKKFEKASNSEISRELCYSDAQFSRLINESGSDGEYKRAIKNVNRIIRNSELEKLANRKEAHVVSRKSPVLLTATIVMGVMLAWLGYKLLFVNDVIKEGDRPELAKDAMLKWSFESSAINSYTKLDNLPSDCNFPCYKLQGKWILDEQYKIPFFQERSGFHYLATEVNMYMRCMPEKSPNGDVLEGYEYQKHEIWYDKREQPISAFMNTEDNSMLDSYKALAFDEDENFILLATVHTFFRNEFALNTNEVERSGKVIGREIEFVAESLLEEFFEVEMIAELKSEVNAIISNRLEDFSRPVSCDSGLLSKPGFYSQGEGDTMGFGCTMTGRFPIDYVKTYVLENQFIMNDCQPILEN